jgi:hypothetical protein
MRKILPVISLFFLLACQSKKNQPGNEKPTVPEALQDHSKEISISKRGPDDLVEELYAEKLNQTEALQALKKKMNEIYADQQDSSRSFTDFNSKNERYYQDASGYINKIKDSLLKKEIVALLNNAIQQYKNTTDNLSQLYNSLATKNLAIADRYSGLKLLISLGMMKQFQKDNIPSTAPMEMLTKRQNEIINSLDSAMNKNK